MQTIDTTNSDSKASKLSALDRAIELAKQRAAVRAATEAGETTTKVKAPKEPKVKAEKPVKVVDLAAAAAKDAARAEAKAKLEAERAERKAAGEAKRAAAKAERDSKKQQRGPAHMKKVEKAAARLPKLSQDVQQMLSSITGSLGLIDMTVLALHMQHYVRVQQTAAAHGRKFTNGQRVRFVGGDARYIGMTGEIDQARNIRCFVTVPGVKKPVYVFSSDIEPAEG